jgi:hypothetical protein
MTVIGVSGLVQLHPVNRAVARLSPGHTYHLTMGP